MEKTLIGLGTPICLRRTLLDNLFRRRGCPSENMAKIHDDLLKIGRGEIWRGRIPRSATQAFDRLKTTFTADGNYSEDSSRWSKKVVKMILQQVLSLWWYRNKKRHGNDREEETAIRRKRALARCKALLKKVERVSNRDELFASMEKLSKWNTGTILHYLAGAEPLAEKLSTEGNDGVRPMKKWDRTKGKVYDPP